MVPSKQDSFATEMINSISNSNQIFLAALCSLWLKRKGFFPVRGYTPNNQVQHCSLKMSRLEKSYNSRAYCYNQVSRFAHCSMQGSIYHHLFLPLKCSVQIQSLRARLYQLFAELVAVNKNQLLTCEIASLAPIISDSESEGWCVIPQLCGLICTWAAAVLLSSACYHLPLLYQHCFFCNCPVLSSGRFSVI